MYTSIDKNTKSMLIHAHRTIAYTTQRDATRQNNSRQVNRVRVGFYKTKIGPCRRYLALSDHHHKARFLSCRVASCCRPTHNTRISCRVLSCRVVICALGIRCIMSTLFLVMNPHQKCLQAKVKNRNEPK